MWPKRNCRLTVRAGGKDVQVHRLRCRFAGPIQGRIEFLVSLPPGDLNIQVTSWHKASGSSAIRLPVDGGGEVVVQIR
ncbi:MAG: hypothetical protein ACI89X_002999 [Planctomycetota bacterium]|jgi:hypothetical protein